MRAAILEEPGKIFIKDMDAPICEPGDILIKVQYCGICRTDMKCYTLGQRDLQLPRVLGHEIVGTIVDINEPLPIEQKELKLGHQVQVSPGITCGQCSYCLEGVDNLCDHLKIIGFNFNGGFAEFVRIPARGVKNGIINIFPTDLSSPVATMTEPLACCLNIQESISVGHGDTVAIFGGGRFGILNAKLARSRGAEKIILIETNEHRLKAASDYEFDYFINSTKTNTSSELLRLTKSKGVSVAIPCCPDPLALNTALQVTAKKGRVGFFSGLVMEKPYHFDLNPLHYKEITMTGSYGCTIKNSKDALKLLATGAVNVDSFKSKIITLNEVEHGINLIKNMKELSVIISL